MGNYWDGCAGCADLCMDAAPHCEYLLNHGRPRPCPPMYPDGRCTVRSVLGAPAGARRASWRGGADNKKEETAMGKNMNWDQERARALLEEGKTVEQVAELVGVTPSTVSAFKRRSGLTKPKKEGDGGGTPPAGGHMTAAALLAALGEPAREDPDAEVCVNGAPVRGAGVNRTYGPDGKLLRAQIHLYVGEGSV